MDADNLPRLMRGMIKEMAIFINREDMLELTRRMTVARSAMTRIAGCYMDKDGFVDGTFNTSFLKLKPSQKAENLALAKIIPFSETNKNLKRYHFPETESGAGGMRQLLLGMKSSALKNDALLDVFYEIVAEKYSADHDYGVFFFYSTYDIPLKASDKVSLWDSEEVYEYLICAVCPVNGEYEPGKPECGFIFPAFSHRTEDPDYIDIYQADPDNPCEALNQIIGLR